MEPDVLIRSSVVEGHPAEVLVRAARGADMLVVGNRGHGGFTGGGCSARSANTACIMPLVLSWSSEGPAGTGNDRWNQATADSPLKERPCSPPGMPEPPSPARWSCCCAERDDLSRPLPAVPPQEGPADPVAVMPGRSVAQPPSVGVAATAESPAASNSARLYAPGDSKTVALTFDDGPGKSTAAILAILARYRVPATFFNIGVNMAARPSLVRAEVKGGYAMGNHTWNHPDMAALPAARASRRLDQTPPNSGPSPAPRRARSGRPTATTTPPRSGSRSSAGWACGCGRQSPIPGGRVLILCR